MPMRPCASSRRIASGSVALSAHRAAAASPRAHHVGDVHAAACGRARRPDASARNRRAPKPRASSSATASASPSASAAVVLAVGARLSGQASFVHARRRGARRPRARASSRALPVIAISFAPRRLISGTMRSSSSLSPELEMRDQHVVARDHAEVAVARLAPDARRSAGVPVLARVEAILRAMWPDLPMPLTTTRPLQLEDQRHARRESARRGARSSARTASASISSTWRASSSALSRRWRGRGIACTTLSWAQSISPLTTPPLAATMHDAASRSPLILLAAAVLVVVLFRAPAPAGDARLPARRAWRIGPARAGPGRRTREDDALPRRVRRRVPDVLDRPGVQPAAADGDAPHWCSASAARRWRRRSRSPRGAALAARALAGRRASRSAASLAMSSTAIVSQAARRARRARHARTAARSWACCCSRTSRWCRCWS